MFEGRHKMSNTPRVNSVWWTPIVLTLALVTAGCGTVMVSVEKPVGAHVELYEKDKWFVAFGPDWGTGWDKVSDPVVKPGDPAMLEMDAIGSWLEGATTFFPRQYRAQIDLSKIATYPKTPAGVVEVRYMREVIPPKHQNIVRLWHEGQTLDVLTHLPVDVLADVLYNLGDKFKGLLDEEIPVERQIAAAKAFKTLLEADSVTPKEVESWLKSLLSKEQLDEVCEWVRDGVRLTDVKWVRLGGDPRQEGVPVFWRLVKGFVELFIRQPEIRTTSVNFYEDVILRDLTVRRVEGKLVALSRLKVYAEIKTFDTSYYSDRVVPELDLIQDMGLVAAVRPTPEQVEELRKYGMTRSVVNDLVAGDDTGLLKPPPLKVKEAVEKGDPPTQPYTMPYKTGDKRETLRNGLPPVGLNSLPVTAIRSQVLGALLENEMAFVVVWRNPLKTDPQRFLTTVVTTTPYGMARVWALRGNEGLYSAVGAFDKTRAPLTMVASWVVDILDQRSLFVRLNKPVAVIAFGNRPLTPWADAVKRPVNYADAVLDLEPAKAE